MVIFLLQTNLGITNLHGNVSVTTLLEVNFFAEVVIFGGNSLVISSESGVFGRQFRVLISDAGQFALSVLESHLLVSKVCATAIKEFLGVLDTSLSARKFKIKALELVRLLSSFSGASFVHLLKTSKFTPHLSSLDLDALDLTLEILQLRSLVIVLVSLGDCFFAKATSLEVLLIKHALGASKLIVQVKVLLGPNKTRIKAFFV